MNKKEAIKYLQQLYPNGGHCWLDEQRIEAIDMAVKALQEEPVSKDKFTFTSLPRLLDRIKPTDRAKWYSSRLADALEKEGYITDAKIVRESIKLMNGEKVPMATMDEEPVSEELEQEINKYVNIPDNQGLPDLRRELSDCARHFANWQKAKDESTTEDLGEYINKLSKQFPEVSFAKLSRVAVRVAKWQKTNLWKHADGDDLPEIDREVVALLNNGKVVFAHRPDPKGWDAKSIITEKVEHYTPETYGKGGWNIPNVKWWLDVDKLPKED